MNNFSICYWNACNDEKYYVQINVYTILPYFQKCAKHLGKKMHNLWKKEFCLVLVGEKKFL